MTTDEQNLLEAADALFFEAEAPDGFLASLKSERVFDENRWQRLWQVVASLTMLQNGSLDTWSNYDLTQIIDAIQEEGVQLAGRDYEHLNDFEKSILEANMFIRDIFNNS